MLNNIPVEMRAFPQWVCWRLEDRGGPKPAKVPYCPQTGQKASVTDPRAWATFNDAAACAPFVGPDVVFQPDEPVAAFHGVGFVLTNDDPFALIDLDDTHGDAEAHERQIKVFREFGSYSEVSPSGKGLHIIVKGHIPQGRRRAAIEIYSSERYMTMTGNVYNNAPIFDRGELLNLLWEQMGGPAQTYTYEGDGEQKESDDEVIAKASAAVNGEKFNALFQGQWAGLYPSQSEADFALVDIIAFYTQNRAQIARIFRNSALGQREKAQRDAYLNYMVTKAFDRLLPPVDVEGLRIAYEKILADKKAVATYPTEGMAPAGQPGGTPAGAAGSGLSPQAASPLASHASPQAVNFPPGLVGEVAQFIYDQAPRPVATIALAGAYGFLSGLTGRAYNVSGTGLNQYVILIAKTGRGKEAISLGINKLMTAIKASVPAAADFQGPGEIASSAALLKWIAKYPAFYSIVGEFGLKLKEMSSPTANVHVKTLMRVLLDLWGKSGRGNILQPMAYSDREKNTDAIASPSFTMIGESTPSRFYENLDAAMIADGMVPRFMVLDYEGPRVPLNEKARIEPPMWLVDKLATLAAHCLSLAHRGEVHDVPLSSPAKAVLDAFNVHCDRSINQAANEVEAELWNRAHLKALKLAALYGVGWDYINPQICEGMATRACNEIAAQTETIIKRFADGEVGLGAVDSDNAEAKQLDEMVKLIAAWADPNDGHSKCATYRVSREMHRDGVFPYNALIMRLQCQAAFRKDRQGATRAIERAFKILLEADDVREMPKAQMQAKYGKSARAFVISNPSRFVV